METTTATDVPGHGQRSEVSEQDRSELAGAIAMVELGYAVRVVVAGLHAPEAAVVALAVTAADGGIEVSLKASGDGNVAIVARRR